MMLVTGVRSSWLTVDTNSFLAASSRRSRSTALRSVSSAAISMAWLCRCSVTSRPTHRKPLRAAGASAATLRVIDTVGRVPLAASHVQSCGGVSPSSPMLSTSAAKVPGVALSVGAGRELVGVEQVGERHADHLVGLVAEQAAGAGVEERDPAAVVDADQRRRDRRLEQVVDQPGGGALGGDVDAGHHDVRRVAVVVEDDVVVPHHPQRPAVRPSHVCFAGPRERRRRRARRRSPSPGARGTPARSAPRRVDRGSGPRVKPVRAWWPR